MFRSINSRARGTVGLVAVVCVALTWSIYCPVLSFPFLFDDIIHLRWLENRSILRVWRDMRGMQHYRPLAMSVWAVSQQLFGAHNPLPLHLLSLLLHIANAGLVAWLSYQLRPRLLSAIAAAMLFVTFPFSYQALPSPGSQSKPVSTFLLLLACALYWRGRPEGRRGWLAVAGLSAALAPFAYESAVTGGGFLLLVEYALWRTERIERPHRLALAALAAGLPFIVAWRIVPSSYAPIAFPGWEALWQSSVYFAQGLTWPIALLAKPLMRWANLSDGVATATVSYLALLILIAPYLALPRWRTRRSTVLVVALGWYLLSLLVQWVTLSFRYVIDAPRMLYGPSVGMALLWADLIPHSPKEAGRLHPFVTRIVGLACLTAMAAWGARFASARIDLIRVGLAVLEEAAGHAMEAEEDNALLFVNIPAWITVRESDFALGHEGYTLLPPYHGVGLNDFVYVNHGVERRIDIASLPDVRQEWRAGIGYHGRSSSMDGLEETMRKADRIWVLGYEPNRLRLREAGAVDLGVPPAEGDAYLATYGMALTLQDAELAYLGDEVVIELRWWLRRVLEGPHTVFVHLYAPDGRLLAQADGFPLGGTFPFRNWQAGDLVRDVRQIVPPPGVALEDCVVGVGIYRSDTGDRASAVDAMGNALADGMYRLQVEL